MHGTDEYFEAMLHKQRMRMSIRRNILRRTLSEDLMWADCLKNDPSFEMFRCLGSTSHNKFPDGMETRSQASTPERKRRESLNELDDPTSLAKEEMKETETQNNDTPVKATKSRPSAANKKNKNKTGK